MDYYEEFGVERTAGPEDIRRAYKRLVKLLHPDRCRDPEVKRLADLQMKRLNGILQVLSEPARRAEYDRRMLDPPDAPQHYRPRDNRPPLWFWIAAAIMVLLGFLLLSHNQKTTTPSRAIAALAEAEPHSAPKDQSARARPSPAGRTQPRTVHKPLRESPQAESIPELPLLTALSPEPYTIARTNIGGVSLKAAGIRAADSVAETPGPTQETAASPGWNGDWLYAPGLQIVNGGLYTPEYIELRITQDGSSLHGRYRSRYHVPDRAISPAVNFHFDGVPNGEGALPWTGPGGAHGEVKLRLLPNGVLEVSWEADQMGNELGLISGKAALVRKLE